MFVIFVNFTAMSYSHLSGDIKLVFIGSDCWKHANDRAEYSSKRTRSAEAIDADVFSSRNKNRTDADSTRKAFVSFDVDISRPSTETKNLLLDNRGTTSVRYYWKMTKRFQLLREIVREASNRSWFTFDKNDGIVMSGSTKRITVGFDEKRSGTYYEYWKLHTEPLIIDVLVIFHAKAVAGNLQERIDTISTRLDEKIRGTCIAEVIDERISNTVRDRKEKYIYRYDKEDVFEAVNAKFDGTHRYKKFVYEEKIVSQLQDFYGRVKRLHDPEKWNLRIDELGLLAREMERRDVQNGYESVKWSQQLENIVVQLEEKPMLPFTSHKRYEDVYRILCSYVNNIEQEVFRYKQFMGIEYRRFEEVKLKKDFLLTKHLPTEESAARDVLQGQQVITANPDPKDAPTSALLEDIPIEDYPSRINAYFGTKTAPSAAKRTSHSTEKHDDGRCSPYSTSGMELQQCDTAKSTEPNMKMNDYLLNVYTIFHCNLSHAVNCMENCLDMQLPSRLPLQIVKEIEENLYLNRFVDLEDILMEEKREKIEHSLLFHTAKQGSVNQECEVSQDLSLWSILRSHKSEDSLLLSKPISYPIEHSIGEGRMDEYAHPFKKSLQADKSTATSQQAVDPEWTGKHVCTQRNSNSDDVLKNCDVIACTERLLCMQQTLNEDEEEVEKKSDGQFSEMSLYDLSCQDKQDTTEINSHACPDLLQAKPPWIEHRLDQVKRECQLIDRIVEKST